MRILTLVYFIHTCHGTGAPGIPPAAPASGTVIVRVAWKGRETSPGTTGPLPDVVVVANARGGGLLAIRRTNAHGEAHFSGFPAGGSVTIAEPGTGTRSLWTVLGVEPGDVIDASVDEPILAPRGSLMSSWRSYPGAVDYEVIDGCHDRRVASFQRLRLDLDDRCLSPWRSASAIVYAIDAGGQPLAYATATGISVRAEGSVAVPFPAWKTRFVDVALRMASSSGVTETRIGLRRFDGTATHSFVAPFQSEGGSVRIPAGFFDELLVVQTGTDRRVVRSVPLWEKTLAARGPIDVAGAPDLAVDVPVVSPGTRPVVRTHARDATADLLTGVLRWPQLRWSFVSAPDETTIALPELPADLAVPTGAPASSAVTVADHSHFGSWDEARRQLRWSVAFAEPEDVIDLGGFVAVASAGAP